MDINSYFSDLGFSSNEAEIFLKLYQLGPQVASTISKHLDMDRTTVYKILLKLSNQNLISVTEKNSTKTFFVPDISVLKNHILKNKAKYEKLENDFNFIEAELVKYDNNINSYLPKITIYDGNQGVENIYNDIYDEIVKNNYLSIKFFASNIFESQIYSKSTLGNFSKDFFQKLQAKNIHLDSFLGNGGLIMERISKNFSIDNLEKLPVTDSAINIFVVGNIVYIIIYKDIPFAIKLDSEELANTLYFMLDNLKTED